MVSCNESSQSAAGGVAPRSLPLTRAGLRQPPRGAEPTGMFVVIEMAVLSCVSALAMVSIIVSVDEGVGGQRSQQVSAQPNGSGHAAPTPSPSPAPEGPGKKTEAAQVAR